MLVSDAVLRAADVPGCRFDEVGPTELKGVAKPVVLHHATRAP